VGNVIDLPILANIERRRDRRQALRLRISRRARELAQLDEERYFKAILFQVYRGELDPQLVQFWEPLAGDVGKPARQEA
jgi:hypothetical protein